MAQWISACLFALSANIDNFPIGIAYGLRGMRIGAGGNLILYNDSHMKGYSCWK